MLCGWHERALTTVTTLENHDFEIPRSLREIASRQPRSPAAAVDALFAKVRLQLAAFSAERMVEWLLADRDPVKPI